MKNKVTFYLTKETEEILRRISYVSRKSKSALVEEGIILLSKNPGITK